MSGTFQFLGTGASAGVPVIGCKCEVCTSSSSKNKRFRASGLVQIDGKALLIDIGPDFRSQALQFGIDHLDGLILTHTHFDHIAGIDELRIFNIRQNKPFPCLLSNESFDELKRRYYYFFREKKDQNTTLECSVLEGDMGEAEFLGIKIAFCSFFQKEMKVTGFRFGDFAYISDIQKYEDSIFDALKGVRKLVLSALKPEANSFHFSFDQATTFAARVGADEMNALLPNNVRVAYDGLKLSF